MKTTLLFILMIPTALIAQDVSLRWAKSIGTAASGSISVRTTDIVSDANGNTYSIGDYKGPIDIDPDAGTFNLTDSGMYILKLNPLGAFVWAKEIKSIGLWALSHSLTLDNSGNIYCTGDFFNTIVIDPGDFNATLTSDYPDNSMCFVIKLDTTGNFIWAKKMGKTNRNSETLYSAKADGLGDVYISGSFGDTADFDPGPGTFYLYGTGINESNLFGNYWMFICKLDGAENFLWARAPHLVEPWSWSTVLHHIQIGVDNVGNIYCTGSFAGPVDFDPGDGSLILEGYSVFLWKLTATGDIAFVKKIAELQDSSWIGILDLAVDAIGNSYLIGGLSGTVDFDAGPGIYNLNGSRYIAKYNVSGDFVWAKALQAVPFNFTHFHSLALDGSGNAYITGYFMGTVDFDPGPGIYTMTDTLPVDKFILQIKSNGDFGWAVKTTGIDNGYCSGYSIGVDASENVYTTGYFHGTVDFDPGANTSILTSIGPSNMFVDKLGL